MTIMLIVFLFSASLMAQTRPTPEQIRQAELVVFCQNKALTKECAAIGNSLAPWWNGERRKSEPEPAQLPRLRLRVTEGAGELLQVTMEVVEQTIFLKTPTEELECELVAPLPPVMGKKPGSTA